MLATTTPANFRSVARIPIKGPVTEVTVGGSIHYETDDGYLIFGKIYGPDGKSVSQQATRLATAAAYNTLIENPHALVIGNGPVDVIEVSDPSCEFSRVMSRYLRYREGLTRRIFLVADKATPGDTLAKRVIADPSLHNDVFEGKYDNSKLPVPDVDEQVLKAHRQARQMLGCKGTPFFVVNGTHVVGANIEALEQAIRGHYAAN